MYYYNFSVGLKVFKLKSGSRKETVRTSFFSPDIIKCSSATLCQEEEALSPQVWGWFPAIVCPCAAPLNCLRERQSWPAQNWQSSWASLPDLGEELGCGVWAWLLLLARVSWCEERSCSAPRNTLSGASGLTMFQAFVQMPSWSDVVWGGASSTGLLSNFYGRDHLKHMEKWESSVQPQACPLEIHIQ